MPSRGSDAVSDGGCERGDSRASFDVSGFCIAASSGTTFEPVDCTRGAIAGADGGASGRFTGEICVAAMALIVSGIVVPSTTRA
jgi:hypothetical protein